MGIFISAQLFYMSVDKMNYLLIAEIYYFKLQYNIGNKSTHKAQTSLAEADHYPHIAMIPNLESQQISIWKSDKDTCAQTHLVC